MNLTNLANNTNLFYRNQNLDLGSPKHLQDDRFVDQLGFLKLDRNPKVGHIHFNVGWLNLTVGLYFNVGHLHFNVEVDGNSQVYVRVIINVRVQINVVEL